ncbi:PKD domain-containing protein, partial [Methanorbis furvi]|uniref:PKD domain-containing protein n=1 Tax=Methanorbis furvi TaxID=3028299 RepID=UPI0030B8917D
MNKNMKMMAVLAVLLAAALFVGAASATPVLEIGDVTGPYTVGDPVDISVTISESAEETITALNIYDDGNQQIGTYSLSTIEDNSFNVETTFAKDGTYDITAKLMNSDTEVVASTPKEVTVIDPDAPVITLAADPETVVEGQTFTVTVTGENYVDETVTVTVSYEGAQSGNVELNQTNDHIGSIEFTAVLNEQTISATSDDSTEIEDFEITVTAAEGSEINVNVSAPGAELLSGTFILIDESAGKARLPAGVIFTTSAGDVITTEVGGQITIDDAVASGLYQNLSKGYNFTVKTGTPSGFFLSGDDSVIAGDEYTLTITASGDAYIGETATIYFGDDTPEVTIDSLDTTQDVTHTYTAEGIYTINVTVGDESKYKDVSVADGGRIVDAATHGSAFVYETVRVENDGTAVPKLYFFSSDATPTLIATMTASDDIGTYNLLDASVNGHYGAWYTDADVTSSYITIWYPEISLKAELTTGNGGTTSGDSVDGKTFNKNTEVSFLIEAPNVGPADIADVKIVFTTPAAG